MKYAILLVVVACLQLTLGSYFVYKDQPAEYPECSVNIPSTQIHSYHTLCAIVCRKRNCKYLQIEGIDCLMLGDGIPIANPSTEVIYEIKTNYLTNVAPLGTAYGSAPYTFAHQDGGTSISITMTAATGTNCNAASFYVSNETVSPYWKLQLDMVRDVHAINIHPHELIPAHAYQDVTVYIGLNDNQIEGDFTDLTQMSHYVGPWVASEGWLNHNFQPPVSIQYIVIQKNTRDGNLAFGDVEVLAENDSLF